MKKIPLVSWLIPTTLYDHPWWNRLIEFLEDDFPTEDVECIFVGTQDKNFLYEAQRIGEQVCESLTFIPGVTEKWRRVRFIEQYHPEFNISASRNILLNAAQGDIVIYRDADTSLIRPGFTSFAIQELLRSRYGMLSFPSLRNGVHFKPKRSLITLPDPYSENLSLTCSVNGMATVALRSILKELGGWNNSLKAWGEHTALCIKMARAGLLMGYTKGSYWLNTATGYSSLSLTDDRINPQALHERQKGIAMLRSFYNIKFGDVFWDIAHQDYGVNRYENTDVSNMLSFEEFAISQRLRSAIERYDFKPWECLSHPNTNNYISAGRQIAQQFFDSVSDKCVVHL